MKELGRLGCEDSEACCVESPTGEDTQASSVCGTSSERDGMLKLGRQSRRGRLRAKSICKPTIIIGVYGSIIPGQPMRLQWSIYRVCVYKGSSIPARPV